MNSEAWRELYSLGGYLALQDSHYSYSGAQTWGSLEACNSSWTPSARSSNWHQMCGFLSSRGQHGGTSRISRPHALSGLIVLVGSQQCPCCIALKLAGEGGQSPPLWVCWGEGERQGATYHLQDISGDHLHAAHGCGQCTHNGGQDVEGTHTEEEFLWEKMQRASALSWQCRRQDPQHHRWGPGQGWPTVLQGFLFFSSKLTFYRHICVLSHMVDQIRY